MILWRISRHIELNGIGGLRAPGRWHYAGQPVVYLSENAASALLEVCVHTAANDIPPTFTLLKVEATAIEAASISLESLAPGWQTHPDKTRALGTAWLKSNQAALLQIPSAIVPETANYLLNPRHPDAARLRILQNFNYPFDNRLKT